MDRVFFVDKPHVLVSLISPIHDSVLRTLGGGVRVLRDIQSQDHPISPVRIIWIDDDALDPALY